MSEVTKLRVSRVERVQTKGTNQKKHCVLLAKILFE
jgi:hypothetical protein